MNNLTEYNYAVVNEKKITEEWEKEKCQFRWKYNGTFNVVCGAPYPCSQHTSRKDRKKWIDEIVASAVEARGSKIGEHILAIGHNDECMFCGFKDKFATSIINPSKEAKL